MDHISITSSPTDEISETDSFIYNPRYSMDGISIISSPTDEISETNSFIYNPSLVSSGTSISSYKTERTVNSRKSRYNALPRRKYADIGLPNGPVSLGAVSGQCPGGSILHVDAGLSHWHVAVQNAILIDSEASADALRQLGTELKPRVTTPVEYMYNFETGQAPASIIYNTRRAQELLTDMTFIYAEPRTTRDPYRHPIIQRVINTTWFRDMDDIGVVDHEHFSPIPIPIIAITLTVIEWCIGEWSGGMRSDSNWGGAKFQTVYDSHVSSLRDFPAHSSASLYQLQCDLLRNAREHAGVIESTNDPRVDEEDIISEERCEQLLRNVRKLAKENAALISPGDSEIVKERITLATEVELEPKSDLRGPLEARERPKTRAISNPSPPLDASGFLTWKLLHFLDSLRPSAQEARGDDRLDDARKLATENRNISPSDLQIVMERIILARQFKMWSESKRGLSRYLQVRDYRKAAKETLKFVKTIPDRATRDATLQYNSAFPGHDIVFIRHPRGLVAQVDAVPVQATAQSPIPIDSEASGEAHFCYSPPDPLLSTDLYVHSDPRTTTIRRQLEAEMKPNVAVLVESMYNFRTNIAHTSISYNAGHAHELLTDGKFIYLVPQTGRDPYRHPIIQRAIDTTWFRNKDDIGVVDHEHFSPMPIPIIALTLMVIECCINEWSSGERRDSNWDDTKFQTVYDSHVSSLLNLQAHSPASSRDLLHQLRWDLLRNAREHAGVTPDPVTELSRFPPGALDAVREEDNLPDPTDPPDYDDHLAPSITINSA